MGRLLFIGSTVADVVIRLPKLPRTGEDLHVIHQQATLGGCAFNSYSAARLTGAADAVLFSPVGTGPWGTFVRDALAELGLESAAPSPNEPNGCCYCLVEPDGERTFVSDHGAEYRFRSEWFDALGDEVFSGVYLCGLEIEESTGDVLIDYVRRHPPERLLFAPGPRICRIRPERMAALLALHPVMHLNEAEAQQFTRTDDTPQAAELIYQLTGAPVVVTMGSQGAYIYEDGRGEQIPTVPARVVDTIGAGDSHAGALLAGLCSGLSLAEAAGHANVIAAAITEHPGATITEAEWQRWLAERTNR